MYPNIYGNILILSSRIIKIEKKENGVGLKNPHFLKIFIRRFNLKIGIDLGGSHIAIGAIDKNGQILEKSEKRLLEREKQNIKKSIEEYIFEKTEELTKKYKITEMGIAIPGTILNGVVVKSVNLGLENYPIVEKLKRKINLPIKAQNDAKCAAMAESKYGCLKEYKRSIFLTLGTGIGGATIIDGKLLNVGDMPGCEFGHMIIQKDGIQCNCGKKGCFERYASMKAFKNNLRKALGVDEKTRGQELLNKIREDGDNPIIKPIIDEFIEYLSIGISNLINIFEPEAIGIGGSFVYFEDVLLEKLKTNIIENNYLFNKREKIIILPAILGNDAGIIGSCQ